MDILRKGLSQLATFITGFFYDKQDSPSMKRLCGLMCTFWLCLTLYENSFTAEHIAPSTPLVETVGYLAFGCLGLTSIEKVSKIFNNKDKTESVNNESPTT